MSCAEIDDQLDAYVDQQLAAVDRAAVDAHLAACERCARAVVQLRALDHELASVLRCRDRAAVVDRVLQGLPRARARGPFLALAAAAGFFLAYLIFGQHQPSRPEPSLARLTVATGAVEARAARGTWQPLAPGSPLVAGSVLRTPPLVKCALDLQDGTELRLNGDTEITLLGLRQVALERGQVFTRVTPSSVTFAVRTEQALVEALGTTLDIVHWPRGTAAPDKDDADQIVTQVAVLDGRARLGAETVPAGHRCAMVNGATQKPTPAHDLMLMTGWMNELLALKGRDDPEFAARVNDLLAMLGRVKMEYLYESEIRSLGEHCALPLARYLRASKPEDDRGRRQRAAQILADIAGVAELADLVPLLGDADAEVRAAIARALSRLAGTTLDCDERYWRGPDTERGRRAWESFLRDRGTFK